MDVTSILIIFAIVLAFICLFDILPYCLATIVIGRFPPEGPFVWQFLKPLFRRKPRYATWKDIPHG